MDADPRVAKLIIDLYDVNALKFGDFKMKVGVNSPVYFDLRVIVSHPHLLDLLATLMLEMMRRENLREFKHICGVPYTALPIATLVSVKSMIPMLIRRREAKDYGTRKMIEGHYSEGDDCIIIDDVVTTGSSIIDTVRDLSREGLKTSNALVVVDRQQGGRENLKEKGIDMHVLVTLSQVLQILLKAGKITEQTIKDVDGYISKTQINIDGTVRATDESATRTTTTTTTRMTRLTTPFEERAKMAKSDAARRLFELMHRKKSVLCVAADVTTSSALLRLARSVGPHAAVFKTHFDAVEDFGAETERELTSLSRELDFVVMEDRKLSDIGNTVSLQANAISRWADYVTAHALTGESVLRGLKSGADRGGRSLGCFLVAELSSEGSLIDETYTRAAARMAEEHADVVAGLVCQSPDAIISPHLIQMTPGVRFDVGNDGLGQRYNDPIAVVLERGADLAVVGRGITSASDPGSAASTYRETLWKAYERRIAK